MPLADQRLLIEKMGCSRGARTHMAPIVSPSGTPCIMYRMPSKTMLGRSWSTVLSLICSIDANLSHEAAPQLLKTIT